MKRKYFLNICMYASQQIKGCQLIMGLSGTSHCQNCTGKYDQTPLHILYECAYVKPVFLLLLRILSNVCNFKPTSNIRFLYFDQKYCNVTQKNICNMFLYLYISTIWKTRKENIRIGILKNIMLRRISNHINFIEQMPNHSVENLFGNISSLDVKNLANL